MNKNNWGQGKNKLAWSCLTELEAILIADGFELA